MKPEYSFLPSGESAICLYPKPHKSSPPLPTYFFKIPFNIIILSTTRSINYSLCLWFSHQNSKCIAFTRLWCHVPCRLGVTRFQVAVGETASRYGEKLRIPEYAVADCRQAWQSSLDIGRGAKYSSP
jgi:hypothetical protein